MGKTKIYKISAFLLVAIMIISLATGCSANDNEIVYTVDGVDISSGLYLQTELSAYGVAVQKAVVAAQAESETEVDSTSIQYNILKHEVEGIPAGEWIEKETLGIIKRYIAMEKEFDRLGLELTEEEKTAVETKVATAFEGNTPLYNFMGISKKALETIETYNVKAEHVYNRYYSDEQAEEKISVDEALDYLNENFTKALLYPITVSGVEEAKKEEMWDDMTEIAIKLSLDDSNFADLISEFNKKHELNTDSEDKDIEETYGKDKFSVLLTRDGSEYIPKNTVNKIWSLSSFNKYVYFEEDGIGQLIARYEQTIDDAEENYKNLVSGMRREEFQEKLEEISKDYEVTENKNLLRKYSAKKLTKKVKKANELFKSATN